MIKTVRNTALIIFSVLLVTASLPYKKIHSQALQAANKYSYALLSHLKIIPGINLFSEPLRTDYKVLKSCITIKTYAGQTVSTVYHNEKYCADTEVIWMADYFDLMVMRLFTHIPIVKIDKKLLGKTFYDERFGGKRDFRAILHYFCSHDIDLNRTKSVADATAVAIENTFIRKNLEKHTSPTYLAKWDCRRNTWDWGVFYTFNQIPVDDAWKRFVNNEVL